MLLERSGNKKIEMLWTWKLSHVYLSQNLHFQKDFNCFISENSNETNFGFRRDGYRPLAVTWKPSQLQTFKFSWFGLSEKPTGSYHAWLIVRLCSACLSVLKTCKKKLCQREKKFSETKTNHGTSFNINIFRTKKSLEKLLFISNDIGVMVDPMGYPDSCTVCSSSRCILIYALFVVTR